jgi:hypothetical protein
MYHPHKRQLKLALDLLERARQRKLEGKEGIWVWELHDILEKHQCSTHLYYFTLRRLLRAGMLERVRVRLKFTNPKTLETRTKFRTVIRLTDRLAKTLARIKTEWLHFIGKPTIIEEKIIDELTRDETDDS